MSMNSQTKLRLAQIFSWAMVLFWMGVIFWFSSQPAEESVRWSVGLMELGGEIITNWQWVGIISVILLYHIFLIWLAKMDSHFILKIVLFVLFLIISVGIAYFLFTFVRPRVSRIGIFEMNRWVIHRYLRKYAHFFVYLFLGSFLMNAFTLSNVRPWRAFGLALVISFFYAITDEFHQYFVPGRRPLVMDVIIDTIGALVGIALYSTLSALFKWRKRKRRTRTKKRSN